jgi:hypothetical protein
MVLLKMEGVSECEENEAVYKCKDECKLEYTSGMRRAYVGGLLVHMIEEGHLGK